MHLAPMSVCVSNFPAQMRGAIIGLTSSFYTSGPALYGVIYARFYQDGPLGNFYLPLAILCVVANMFAMWILRPLPLQSDSDMKNEEATKEVRSVCFVPDDSTNPTNSWHIRLGIGLLKLPVFHIFSWSFLLAAVPQIAIIINTTAMATAFGHKRLAVTLPIYGPISGIVITPAVGFVSDGTLQYVSRLLFVFIGHLPQFLFYIVAIFCGDNSYILSGLVVSSYIQCGFHSAIIPTLITEYFGSRYFMSIWGAELLTNSLLVMIMNVIIGVLYQDAITDGGTDCYGLVCFQSSFILGTMMSGVALLLLAIMWNMERKKAQEYQSMK